MSFAVRSSISVLYGKTGCPKDVISWNSAATGTWQFQDPKTEVLYHVRPHFVEISPYIGLIYGRYLQLRFLKWPLNYVWCGLFLNVGVPEMAIAVLFLEFWG